MNRAKQELLLPPFLLPPFLLLLPTPSFFFLLPPPSSSCIGLHLSPSCACLLRPCSSSSSSFSLLLCPRLSVVLDLPQLLLVTLILHLHPFIIPPVLLPSYAYHLYQLMWCSHLPRGFPKAISPLALAAFQSQFLTNLSPALSSPLETIAVSHSTHVHAAIMKRLNPSPIAHPFTIPWS